MNRIARYYLCLLPWELFVLLVVTPVVARALSGTPLSPEPGQPPGPWWYQVFSLAWFAMLSGWFYSVGIAANSRVKEDIRAGSTVFSLAAAYPILYVLVITMLYGGETQIEPPQGHLAAIALSSLLTLACIGYTIRFVAKNLWMAEQERSVDFRRYGGTLFLLMFYPVALWFVQARVRKLYAKESASGES